MKNDFNAVPPTIKLEFLNNFLKCHPLGSNKNPLKFQEFILVFYQPELELLNLVLVVPWGGGGVWQGFIQKPKFDIISKPSLNLMDLLCL